VRWSTNGHYYLAIGVLVDFNTALSSAAAMTYNGEQGYLATITSAAENSFVASLCASSTDYWLGGSDAQQEGVWRWVAGPENGQIINGFFWAATQPSGVSTQNYLDMFNGVWFDDTSMDYYYYIVEFGCKEPYSLVRFILSIR
jgi:hypothetical protein